MMQFLEKRSLPTKVALIAATGVSFVTVWGAAGIKRAGVIGWVSVPPVIQTALTTVLMAALLVLLGAMTTMLIQESYRWP